MNREAAALGVPAVSVYAGKWAAVDEELVKEGRLLQNQHKRQH
jgi:predicted glycosyltransferase